MRLLRVVGLHGLVQPGSVEKLLPCGKGAGPILQGAPIWSGRVGKGLNGKNDTPKEVAQSVWPINKHES